MWRKGEENCPQLNFVLQTVFSTCSLHNQTGPKTISAQKYQKKEAKIDLYSNYYIHKIREYILAPQHGCIFRSFGHILTIQSCIIMYFHQSPGAWISTCFFFDKHMVNNSLLDCPFFEKHMTVNSLFDWITKESL